MVVMDATTLLLLFRPDDVEPPIDPATGQEVVLWRERVSSLTNQFEKAREKIVIPTPGLSEMLVRAGGDAANLLDEIGKRAVFRIEAFDTRAAIEVALMTKAALDRGNKKNGMSGTWAKVKYDRQIVAIAKVVGATAIYSDDGNIQALGKKLGIKVISIADVPLTDDAAQGRLNFTPPAMASETETSAHPVSDDEDVEHMDLEVDQEQVSEQASPERKDLPEDQREPGRKGPEDETQSSS